MKKFNKIIVSIIAVIIFIFISLNVYIVNSYYSDNNKLYLVEINRIENLIKQGKENFSLSQFNYVYDVKKYDGSNNFYKSSSQYQIRKINDKIYRFDYKDNNILKEKYILAVNISLSVLSLILVSVLLFIKYKILKPFDRLKGIPRQLSKGHLNLPIYESKNKYFGKFIWSVNILNEELKKAKENQLKLTKEKQTTLLSLSHDIKTPLCAIKLYAKAMSKNLYKDTKTQYEIADKINNKVYQIENYINHITRLSNEDFLSLEVNNDEFYMSVLIDNIKSYYLDKLSLLQIDFNVNDYCDILLKGDIDRAVEVVQNIMENAVKYGDGKYINIDFQTEDDIFLVEITNSGCTLTKEELNHIFDSFWRGSNIKNENGSGLGLYIAQQLMRKMHGEIFAKIKDRDICITVAFTKA